MLYNMSMSSSEFTPRIHTVLDQPDTVFEIKELENKIRWTAETFADLEKRMRLKRGEPDVINVSSDDERHGWFLEPQHKGRNLIQKLGFFLMHDNENFRYGLSRELSRSPYAPIEIKTIKPTGGLVDTSNFVFAYEAESLTLRSLDYHRKVDAYDVRGNLLDVYPSEIGVEPDSKAIEKQMKNSLQDMTSMSQLRFNEVSDMATEFREQLKTLNTAD